MDFPLTPHGKLIADYQYWTRLFIDQKKIEKKSPLTIAQYERILNTFEEFIRQYDEEIGFDQINRLLIDGFLREMRLKKKSDNTIKTYMTVLKSFFLFVSENNRELKDFTKIFSKYKISARSNKTHETLTREEVERLIRYVEHVAENKRTFKANRDALAIKLLVETGMRSSSLLSLKLKDFEEIEYKGHHLYKIRIWLKRDKEMFVYVKKDLIDLELAHCRIFLKNDPESYLFINPDTKERLSRKQLYNIATTAMERVGIRKRGVHIFRHTFTQLKRSEGVDLSTIQALLGHSSITTTINIYGKAGEEDKILTALKSAKK